MRTTIATVKTKTRKTASTRGNVNEKKNGETSFEIITVR